MGSGLSGQCSRWEKLSFGAEFCVWRASSLPFIHSSSYSAVNTLRLRLQDKRCTYNITLRHIRVTIVAEWKQNDHISWVCVCSLSYPTSNDHEPYSHLWPALLYSIFPHYLINGMVFGKRVNDHKMCVLILCTILFEILVILRRIHRDVIISVHTPSRKVPVILLRF